MDFNDTPELAEFRGRARAWLEANATRRRQEGGAITLFGENGDGEGALATARFWQAKVFDAGWAGLTVPPEYGGAGLSPLYQIVWQQEAAHFALPVDVFGIGIGMGAPTLVAWGTEQQKGRWLRPMLRGDEIWCQLFSEPGAGSDVASLRTRATRDGGEWLVNGQKVWTSGAHYSRWGLLLARTDPAASKHRGLTYFIVDMNQPGVEVRPLRQMTGGSNFNEVFFVDARVPDENVIGGEGMGWSVAVTTLMNERLSIGAALLSAEGAFGSLRQLAQRFVGDASLRDRLVDLYARGQVLRFMAQRIISTLVRGGLPTALGSAAKIGLSDVLTRFANLGIDVQGGAGLLAGPDAVDDGVWQLIFTGYPGMRIAGGTDEIMRNIIGERILALPAEPRLDKGLPWNETVGAG